MGWGKFLGSLLGIDAAANVIGAVVTSHGASKAAKYQVEAARQAQAFNEKTYGEQKQMMAPYMAMGTDAMQRYGQYAARPFNERLASLGQPYSPATAAGGPFALGPQQPQHPPQGGVGMGGSLAGLIGGTPAPAQIGGGFGFGGQQPQGGGVVLRAPTTGEIMQVDDPQEAQRLMGLGATRVQ